MLFWHVMGITYRKRMHQPVDFSGLQWGSIAPIDIDGLVEYKDKAYAIIELKHRDAELPTGQRIALERMVDDFQGRGKLAAAFLCEHYVDNPNEDIIAEDSIVRSCYYLGRWRDDGIKTLGERLGKFMTFAESL